MSARAAGGRSPTGMAICHSALVIPLAPLHLALESCRRRVDGRKLDIKPSGSYIVPSFEADLGL